MFRILLAAIAVVISTVLTVSAGEPARKSRTKPRARPAAGAEQKQGQAGGIETVNPGVFLLRDPLVQTELQLSPEQKSAAARLAAEFNESIWRFRDASGNSEVAIREARLLNAAIEPRLGKMLEARQKERLAGIVLQVQGPSALELAAMVDKLSLSREQQAKISKLLSTARESAAKLSAGTTGSNAVSESSRPLEKLQGDLQRDLMEVLSAEQRDRWKELRGKAIELSKLRPLTAQAPELRGVTDWINSEPLTIKELRGKVVALHFWTFG